MQCFGMVLLYIAILPICHAQDQQTAERGDAVRIQPSLVPKAPLLPSADYAPIPDLGAMPVPYNSASPIKRALRRLDPNCLDAIFHLCWSSPRPTTPFTD